MPNTALQRQRMKRSEMNNPRGFALLEDLFMFKNFPNWIL